MELLLEPGVAPENAVPVLGVAVAHVGAGGLELVNDAIETPRTKDPVTCDDGQVTGAGILRQVRHRHRTTDRTRRWEGLAGEHSGKGGLAGPVAPDKPDPVPGRDLEGHRLEEQATAGCELEVGGSDHEGRSWFKATAVRQRRVAPLPTRPRTRSARTTGPLA